MSELQQSYGLPVKRRFRGKSLAVQLQLALDHLAALAKVKRKDETYITEVKAGTIRVKTLNWMISRKESQKFKKLERANAKLQSEVAELQTANEKLAALAGRPVPVVSPVTAVEEALARYHNTQKHGGARE